MQFKGLTELDTLLLETQQWRKPDARTLDEFSRRLAKARADIVDEMRRLAALAPDWSAAPEWAQWWAADDEGTAFWFEVQPEMGAIGWLVVGDVERVTNAPQFDLGGRDWRLTLQQRPSAVTP